MFGGNCGALEEAAGEYCSLIARPGRADHAAHGVFGAGYSADFYMFDVSRMKWTSLESSIAGLFPGLRVFPGFATLVNRVYLFGGFSPYDGNWHQFCVFTQYIFL